MAANASLLLPSQAFATQAETDSDYQKAVSLSNAVSSERSSQQLNILLQEIHFLITKLTPKDTLEIRHTLYIAYLKGAKRIKQTELPEAVKKHLSAISIDEIPPKFLPYYAYYLREYGYIEKATEVEPKEFQHLELEKDPEVFMAKKEVAIEALSPGAIKMRTHFLGNTIEVLNRCNRPELSYALFARYYSEQHFSSDENKNKAHAKLLIHYAKSIELMISKKHVLPEYVTYATRARNKILEWYGLSEGDLKALILLYQDECDFENAYKIIALGLNNPKVANDARFLNSAAICYNKAYNSGSKNDINLRVIAETLAESACKADPSYGAAHSTLAHISDLKPRDDASKSTRRNLHNKSHRLYSERCRVDPTHIMRHHGPREQKPLVALDGAPTTPVYSNIKRIGTPDTSLETRIPGDTPEAKPSEQFVRRRHRKRSMNEEAASVSISGSSTSIIKEGTPEQKSSRKPRVRARHRNKEKGKSNADLPGVVSELDALPAASQPQKATPPNTVSTIQEGAQQVSIVTPLSFFYQATTHLCHYIVDCIYPKS